MDAGCRVTCVTTRVSPSANLQRLTATSSRRDDDAIAARRKAIGSTPLVVKGVATPDEVRRAIDLGADGLVASPYGIGGVSGNTLILQLPSIVQAAAGRVPVLADGGFRRGTDIIKALALGDDGPRTP